MIINIGGFILLILGLFTIIAAIIMRLVYKKVQSKDSLGLGVIGTWIFLTGLIFVLGTTEGITDWVVIAVFVASAAIMFIMFRQYRKATHVSSLEL